MDTNNHNIYKFHARKLFIGGLHPKMTEAHLSAHFKTYGPIESIVLKTHINTGKSKGYAFIEFKSQICVTRALAIDSHVICEKIVDVKRALLQPSKLYVGGLSDKIKDEDVRKYFRDYGNIVTFNRPYDRRVNRRKTFCILTFDSVSDVNSILKIPNHKVKGITLNVQRARSASSTRNRA